MSRGVGTESRSQGLESVHQLPAHGHRGAAVASRWVHRLGATAPAWGLPPTGSGSAPSGTSYSRESPDPACCGGVGGWVDRKKHSTSSNSALKTATLSDYTRGGVARHGRTHGGSEKGQALKRAGQAYMPCCGQALLTHVRHVGQQLSQQLSGSRDFEMVSGTWEAMVQWSRHCGSASCCRNRHVVHHPGYSRCRWDAPGACLSHPVHFHL